MFMNEKEAGSRWCPMARVWGEGKRGVAAINRGGSDIYDQTRCVGSACMMWVWGPKRVKTGQQIAIHQGIKTVLEPETVPVEGRCGLKNEQCCRAET